MLFMETHQFKNAGTAKKYLVADLMDHHKKVILDLQKNIGICSMEAANAETFKFLSSLIQQHEAIIAMLKKIH